MKISIARPVLATAVIVPPFDDEPYRGQPASASGEEKEAIAVVLANLRAMGEVRFKAIYKAVQAEHMRRWRAARRKEGC